MDLSRYVKNAEKASFGAGETIFREGDEGSVMYVILDGEVELSTGGAPLGRLGAGQALGEMAVIDKQPRSATAVAATSVTAAGVNQGTFLVLVQDTPMFAIEVMRALVERLRRSNDAASV